MTVASSDVDFPVWAVVPAAGQGKRLPGPIPKQYRKLLGKTVLDHALSTLLAYPAIQHLVVAVSAEDEYWPQSQYCEHPRLSTCPGGAERADSVLAGLDALAAMPQAPGAKDAVLVHDAARALLPRSALDSLLQQPPGADGALLALPCQDSLKFSEDGQQVTRSLNRALIWQAQTPQMFEFAALRAALRSALQAGEAITDEASCMERAGLHPRLVRGDARNLKITTAGDFVLAKALLEAPCE